VFAVRADTIEDDEVVVVYEKPLRNSAGEVMRIYPFIREEIENTFKSKIDFKPTVMIKDGETFQDIVGNTLIVAVALPQRNLVIIDNSKMNTHPFTLEVTLKHELCHLFLHHFVQNDHLPKWFNEGVSQWVSGGISEIIIGEDKDLLKQAALSGRLLRMRDLAERFPEDSQSLLLAYQESKSIVKYIHREFGPDGIMQIMNYVKKGNSFDMAVFKALSIPVDELEKKWHMYLNKKITWFTYVSSHLYRILFSLTALALVYGFIKAMFRKRAYKDEEEEENS
jgi:hypothetical protein